MVKVRISLGGGLELLFGNKKAYEGDIAGDGDIRALLTWMKDAILQQRPELFLAGSTVRPGILVLINDADWELEGQLDYKLKDGDEVAFISTLHGG